MSAEPPRLTWQLGMQLLQQGRAALLERLLRERLAAAPAEAETLMLLANALVDQDRAGEAEAVARAAIAAAPDWAGPVSTLGRVLVALQRAAEARQAVDRAIEMAPTWAGFRRQLAELHAAAGEHRAALAAAADGLRLDATEASLLALHAETLSLLGDDAGAGAAVAAALQVHPDHARLLHLRGHLLVQRGEHAAAIDSLRQSLRLKPGHAAAQRDLDHALRSHSRTYRWLVGARRWARMREWQQASVAVLLLVVVLALPGVLFAVGLLVMPLLCIPGVVLLMLWLHPVARCALSEHERLACRAMAAGLGLVFVAGVVALVVGRTGPGLLVWTFGAWFCLCALPAPRSRGRLWGMIALLIALGCLALVASLQ